MIGTYDIKVNGMKTRVAIRKGENSTKSVVLLHDGAWGSSAMLAWGKVMSYLPQDWQVVAPDMLGFGHSEKAYIHGASHYDYRIRHISDLMNVLSIDEPVHFVGTSFGGSLILRAASKSAWNMASGISISGTGGPGRTPLSKEVLGNFKPGKGYIREVVKLIADTEEGLDDHIEERYQLSCDSGHYMSMMAPRIRHPEEHAETDHYLRDLANVSKGVLTFIGMENDPLVSQEWYELLEKDLVNIQVHKMNGPHCPNLIYPEVLATQLVSILNDHDRSVLKGDQ